MFQVPVNNLERIRKARKKVKGILLELGLESCRDLLQEINGCGPEENYFSSTSWADLSLWETTGKRKKYRTKPFCCSLCTFSAKIPSSLKHHLHRNHEDEVDQELVVPCPSCAFSSQSKTVVKHMRLFHTSVRKFQNPTVNSNSAGAGQVYAKKDVQFACQKCSFSDTLYYSMKKHVLVTHFDNVVAAYFGEMPPNFNEIREYAALTSEQKNQLPNKYYCKKCHTPATSPDTLIYHILTSEKHRDLEYELRSLISEYSRAPVKRMGPSKHMSLAPKSQASTITAAVPRPNPACVQLVSYPQHNINSLMLGQSAAMPVVSNSGSMMHTSPVSVMPQSHVGYLPNSIPMSQSMSLQSSLSQSIFVSQGFQPGVHHGNHSMPSGVLQQNPYNSRPGMFQPYQSVRSGGFSPNQSLHSGGLHINQSNSGGFPLNHSVPQGLFSVNQSARPRFFPSTQNVRLPNIPGTQTVATGSLPANRYISQGGPQNNFIATGGPLMQQLIPTGKQVNGMPTFTIASVPVTLPGSQGGVAAVNTSQVPLHLSQSNAPAQVSQSPANTLSLSAIASPQNLQDQSHRRPALLQSADENNTKQWKTCPVCSELFPSNVYQVHLQVAHKQQVGVQNQERDWVHQEKFAARAPFLRLVKEKVVRCLSCKCFVSEEELLKHLMHGIECLYCTWTFHDLKSFVEHNMTLHSGYKKMPLDYNQTGLQLANDSKGNILFPHFDFNTKMSQEILGGKEIHLALLASSNTKVLVPIYIKVQSQIGDGGVSCVKQALKCPFCQSAFAGLEVYENHLKERHHIMPTVHTILKTPAFKCIHCCGVYTGNMTLAAISVHLLRCRSAPKEGSFGLQAQSNGETFLTVNGETHGLLSKTKSLDSSFVLTADQRVKEQALELALALSRKKKQEIGLHPVQFPAGDDLRCLALDPKQYQNGSKGDPKQFLTDYFHRRPYPTKREVEILSSVFSSWKIDVAEFFCVTQQLCLKSIESQESCVVMGFNMSDLKNVKHKLSIGRE